MNKLISSIITTAFLTAFGGYWWYGQTEADKAVRHNITKMGLRGAVKYDGIRFNPLTRNVTVNGVKIIDPKLIDFGLTIGGVTVINLEKEEDSYSRVHFSLSDVKFDALDIARKANNDNSTSVLTQLLAAPAVTWVTLGYKEMQTDLEVDYRYALEDAEDTLAIHFAGQDMGDGQVSFSAVGMPREWTSAVADLLNGQTGQALQAVGGDLMQNGIKDRVKLTRVEVSYNDDNFAERYFKYQKIRERWLQGQEPSPDDTASENKHIQESVEKLVELGFPKDQSIEFVEAVFAFVKDPDKFEFKAELDELSRDEASIQKASVSDKQFLEKKVSTRSKPEELILGKWRYTDGEMIIEFFKDQTFVTSKNGVGGQWVALEEGRVKLEHNELGTKKFSFARVKGDLLEIETGKKENERYLRSGSGEEKAQQDGIKAAQLFDEKKYAEARQLATSAADKGNAIASYVLYLIYESGLGVENDYFKAIKYSQTAADGGIVAAANGAAWLLATAPADSMRDGKKAIEYALKAVSAEPNSASYVDTYAVVLARTGDFANAMEQENKALGLYFNAYRDNKLTQPKQIYEIAAHRELFKSGKVFDLSMKNSPEFMTLVNRLEKDGIGIVPGMPIEITAVKLFQGLPHPTSEIPPLGNRYYLTTFPQINVFGVEVHYNVSAPMKQGEVVHLQIDCEPQCKENLFTGNVNIDAPQGINSYIASSKAGNFYNYDYLPANDYKLVLNMTGGQEPIRIFSHEFRVHY